MDDAEDVVEVENVDIIRDMEWGLFCRIGTNIRFIPQILLGAGSVRNAGEHGSMTMPKWLATGIGLASPSRSMQAR
jgi:hypothetical protein